LGQEILRGAAGSVYLPMLTADHQEQIAVHLRAMQARTIFPLQIEEETEE
jgi:hypothetical protein